MTQDETYQTNVYQEMGGARYVAGSGGVFAIESGGSIVIYSGAQMTLESGMALAGVGIAGLDLRKALISNQAMDSLVPIAASLKLTISNLPKNVGTYIIYGSATVISASFWLTSVSAGKELYLGLFGDSTGALTNNQTQVGVSTSGCIILGSVGGYISNFTMNTSGASDVLIHLLAVADNTWAIIDQRGDVNEAAGV